MNTANAIEPVDSGLWKATKKGAFPNGDAMDDKMQARILKYGQY